MKTITIKVDNTIVYKAMKRGGFKKPEEAVSFALKKFIETPKMNDFGKDIIKHSPIVESLTGIFPSEKDPDEMLSKALMEKY
jgi:hypothetical protein